MKFREWLKENGYGDKDGTLLSDKLIESYAKETATNAIDDYLIDKSDFQADKIPINTIEDWVNAWSEEMQKSWYNNQMD